MHTNVSWSLRRRVMLVAFVSALLFYASPASASTVGLAANPDSGGKVVFYEAAPGEVNGLYPYIGATSIQLQDGIGPSGVVINPEAPCVSGQDGSPPPPQPTNFATCPKSGVDLIAADLDDEDDRFSGMIYTLPVVVAGGSGGDELYGGGGGDAFITVDSYVDLVRGGKGIDTCECEEMDDVAGVP